MALAGTVKIFNTFIIRQQENLIKAPLMMTQWRMETAWVPIQRSTEQSMVAAGFKH